MNLRIVLAALAVTLPGVALAAEPPARELIYGAELMAPEEREAYRRDIEQAASKEGGESRVRERHRERLRDRARSRGVELVEPHGVVKKK